MKLTDKTIEAYWISPEKKIIPVEKNHITTVIDDPSLFNLFPEYITSCYEKHNEPLYKEGEAQREIMLSLFKKGWIRIRKYPKDAKWVINMNEISEENRIIIHE